MVLYGYTIGDADINPNQAGEQFAVYRFPISPLSTTPQKVGEINAANIPNADLEGLGTNPTNQRVSAINEARASGSPIIDPDVILVNNVDQPFAPATVSPTPTPSDLRRFGFDSGADFGRDFSAGGQPIVLYNISGNNSSSNAGSSLYKVTPGAISLVDGFGAPTTAAQRQGTQATNPGKFADGLAIDNLNPGRSRALASDFSTADGDGAQLYKVDLLTGELSAPITVRNTSGQPLNVNADSGLAFANSGSSQRLFALLETGAVYEITGYQDELAASGLGLGSTTGTNGAGFATATLLGNVNLPSAVSGDIDYEGFTIVNE